MRKLSKKQIDAMRSAITGAWVTLRDQGLRIDAWRAGLANRRRELVLAGLRERIAWHDRQASEKRAAAEHFRQHPTVYGDATPEMIACSTFSSSCTPTTHVPSRSVNDDRTCTLTP